MITYEEKYLLQRADLGMASAYLRWRNNPTDATEDTYRAARGHYRHVKALVDLRQPEDDVTALDEGDLEPRPHANGGQSIREDATRAANAVDYLIGALTALALIAWTWLYLAAGGFTGVGR